MSAYKDFQYWFKFCCKDTFYVIDKNVEGFVAKISNEGVIPFDVSLDSNKNYDLSWRVPEISEEFELFQDRPEYAVYNNRYLGYDNPQDALIQEYENKLTGCAMIRAQRNGFDPDEAGKKLEKCLDWLRNTDFYIAPASTRFHDSQPFGLLKHSLDVADKIIALCDVDSFKSVLVDEAVLCALVHDWCKIGLYESYQRNVKNEQGQWVQVQAYNRGVSKYPLGHGEASMWLASKFFKLSLEECLAIRYHMGRWNISQDSLSELQVANESYPMVHMLQFADQLAVVKY